MPGGIEVLPDRGEIRVGNRTFSGGATADGGLRVGGRTVLPLTLSQRDTLVALSVGADRVRTLALLVGDAALEPGGRPASGAGPRAAIEAVALYLAGATMPGPLTRTALLVGRCVGAAAGTIAAREADRLAQALAVDLPGGPGGTAPVEYDEGWTTISYGPVPPAAPTTAGDSETVADVRDRLAAQLIARDELALGPEMVEALLARAPLDQATRPERPTDRPSDGPVDAVAQAPADRWHGDRILVGAGPARGSAAPRPDRTTSGSPVTDATTGPAGLAQHLVASLPAPGRRRAHTARQTDLRTSPPPSGGVLPLSGHRTADDAAVPPPDVLAPASRGAALLAPVRARPLPGTGGPTAPGGPRTTLLPESAAQTRTPAPAGYDIDATARALHRAADLRGAPR